MNRKNLSVREILSYILIRFLIIGLFIFCFAQKSPADDAEKNLYARAGVFNFDGYHMRSPNDTLSGYGIDVLNLISEYAHINFEFTGFERSWQEMQEMLKNGEIDVVTSARRTPEREEFFAFSLPLGRNQTVLTIHPDNNRLIAGDYKTYNGMTVGEVEGSTQNAKLEKFADNKGFTYKRKEFSDPEELAQSLQNGEIDAILSSNLRKMTNEKLLDVIETDNFYAMVRKDDQALLNEINYAIEQMDQNEGDWKNVLYYKYYGRPTARAANFTKREKDFIDNVKAGQKKIVATAMGNKRPYAWIDNGSIKGILPDYFAAAMDIAGLPYEIITPRNEQHYDELIENNFVDVILDSNFPVVSREQIMAKAFETDPYLSTGIAKVIRQDFNGKIQTVAIAENPNGPPINPSLLEDIELLVLPTAEAAMQTVLDGNADAAYVFPYSAQLFVNHDPSNSLYYSMLNDKGVEFRMQVRNTIDHELITILNKAINHMPVGTLNQLISKYTSFSLGDMSFRQYLQANPNLLISFVVIAFIVLSILLAFFLRSRLNRALLQKTRENNRILEDQLAIVEALSRDYSNVFAVNEQNGSFKVIKLEGYVTEGLNDNKNKEFPYSPLLSQYIATRVHPEDRAYLNQALSLDGLHLRLENKDQVSGTYRILVNNKVHHFQYTFIRIKEKNTEPFILLGFRNIDDAISKEKKQQKLLREALEKATYASNAKTKFLNNMSHDIRTPMNAIIGFTSLASTHIENKTQVQNYLSKISTSGNHLLSLINDVLDMSRIESGKVKIEEKETSLPEIMHDLKTIVQADVKAKQLEFNITTENITNEYIICDRLRLNQVLFNILSNAMKYTLPGGKVSVRICQIDNDEKNNGPEKHKARDVKSAKTRASFEFCIKDTGIGMSDEFLQHVFEPFEREKTSTVSGIQGTGLGLAITKNIVDMMGGTITVTSNKGEGSEFIVHLSFAIPDHADPAETESLEVLKGLRALVVDDNVETCTSVSKMLGSLGIHADWTTFGREAVVRATFAYEQNTPYNFYFLDWLMPDMNGVELTRRLRQIIGDKPSIFIFSAYDWTEMEDEAKTAGVSAFCAKPIFLSDLQRLLVQTEERKDEETEAKPDFSGHRLLLVEDNEMNQEIAQMILTDVGFEVDIVEDGSLAVEKIKEMPANTYDLILMDVQMPIMDGYEATRRIRALPDKEKASITIIAMTANAFEEDRKEAMEAGMNGYVAKPINLKEFIKTLDQNIAA